jgi:hypothetical protein
MIHRNPEYYFFIIRLFVFLDEWMTYYFLLNLWLEGVENEILITAVTLSIIFNYIAYKNLVCYKRQVGIMEAI